MKKLVSLALSCALVLGLVSISPAPALAGPADETVISGGATYTVTQDFPADGYYTRPWQLYNYVGQGYNSGELGPIIITRGTLDRDYYRYVSYKPLFSSRREWVADARGMGAEDFYLVTLSGTETPQNSDIDNSDYTTGFGTDASVVAGQTTDYERNVVRVIRQVIPEGSRIVLSGHSLGGMIAQRVAANSEIKGSYEVLLTTTFGSPSISWNMQEGDVQRLGTHGDTVPNLSSELYANQKEIFWEGKNPRGSNIYSGVTDPHSKGYRTVELWESYDALGFKNVPTDSNLYGASTFHLDYSTQSYFLSVQNPNFHANLVANAKPSLAAANVSADGEVSAGYGAGRYVGTQELTLTNNLPNRVVEYSLVEAASDEEFGALSGYEVPRGSVGADTELDAGARTYVDGSAVVLEAIAGQNTQYVLKVQTHQIGVGPASSLVRKYRYVIHGHAFAEEWSHDESTHWHDCELEGCDGTRDSHEAHSEGAWIVDTAPTAYAEGARHTECEVCGVTLREEAIDSLQTFEVTLDAGEGELPEGVSATLTRVEGEPVGALPTPTREGYEFVGWTLADGTPVGQDSVVASDLVLVASWSKLPEPPATRTLSYDTGLVGVEIAPATAAEGETVTLADAPGEREGYAFAGWLVDGEVLQPGDPCVLGARDVVAMAVWNIDFRIVEGADQLVERGNSATFVSNAPYALLAGVSVDGTPLAPTDFSAHEGSTVVTLSARFVDTLSAGTHVIEIDSTRMAAGCEFTVLAAPVRTATLSFDANGGFGQMEGLEAEPGADVTVPEAGFALDGYELVGWNTAADGSGQDIAAGSVVSMPEGGLTLYAQWRKLPTPDAPQGPEVPSGALGQGKAQVAEASAAAAQDSALPVVGEPSSVALVLLAALGALVLLVSRRLRTR